MCISGNPALNSDKALIETYFRSVVCTCRTVGVKPIPAIAALT